MQSAPAKAASKAYKALPRDTAHQCPQCDHISATRELLRRHQLGHRKPTRRCAECGKMFRYRQNLTRHLTTVHNMGADGNRAPEMWPCDFAECYFVSHRKDKLKDHMLAVHPKEPMLTCGLSIYRNMNRPCVFVCFTPERMLYHRVYDRHGHQFAEYEDEAGEAGAGPGHDSGCDDTGGKAAGR